MSNTDYTLTSGAVLHVTTAPFGEAKALMKALAKCAKGLPLKDDILKSDISALKDYVVEAIASDEVESALFACARRATYQNVKVTPELFDDAALGDKAREDYFEICAKIIEANGGPFFVKAFSMLKARMGAVASSPTSA